MRDPGRANVCRDYLHGGVVCFDWKVRQRVYRLGYWWGWNANPTGFMRVAIPTISGARMDGLGVSCVTCWEDYQALAGKYSVPSHNQTTDIRSDTCLAAY